MDPTIQALQQLSCLEPSATGVAWGAVDWPALVQLAWQGGVPGLVDRAVERLAITVPSAARLELAKACLLTEGHNRVALAEAARLQQAAAARGLTLVPIKGAALLMDRPYDALDQRVLSDLDLVARRAELGELERMFAELGLVPRAGRDLALRHEHHVRYDREDGPLRLMVELHWTPHYVLYGAPGPDEAALGRLVSHRFGGVDYRLLDATDTLLSLLLHLAMHRFRGQLKWAVDVAEALAWFEGHVGRDGCAGVDWRELDRRAAVLGARRAVALGLVRCAKSLGLARLGPQPGGILPGGIRHGLRWRMLRRLTPAAGLLDDSPQPAGWQRALTDFALCDRLVDGLHYVLLKGGEVHERRHRARLPDWLVRRGLDR